MKNFKDLLTKKSVLGSWVTLANPSIAEIMAQAGFDFLVIDMEHSALTMTDVQNLVMAIQGQGVIPLVRIGNHDPDVIKRVMDTGAQGIIAAMVNNAQQAKQVVAAVKYPPTGNRGVGLARAQGYGFDFQKYRDESKRQTTVMAIIEHHEAIRNLESILAVDGLDGTLIGPYDLSGSLGYPGEFERPIVKDAIQIYEQTCKKLKKPMGFHIVQPDQAKIRLYRKKGFKFLALGIDTIFLGLKCREVLRQAKKLS